MNCPRCSGLLVHEYVPTYDFSEASRSCHRCINCGFRNDLVYAYNRKLQQQVKHEDVPAT